MNRLQIRNLVIQNTGRTDKVSLINSAINLALEELSAQRAWLDLQVEDEVTSTTGEESVALETDASRVSEIRVINGTSSYKLKLRPKTWVVSHYPNVPEQSTGKPSYGYLEGRDLFLVPRPNEDFVIRYTYSRLHPELSTDSEEVLIRCASSAVVAYATYWTFKAIEKFQESDHWYATYQTLLRSAKKVDMDNAAKLFAAEPRGAEPVSANDYWLDPFVKRMP